MELLHGSGGSRLAWPSLPPAVRARVDAITGSPVVRAVNQPGGFSPGVAARALLADGRRVFVKAVGAVLDPFAPVWLRNEIDVLARLPRSLPVPPLLGAHDDGEWVAAVLCDVDGRLPVLPWRRDELDLVLAALAALATAGTPSPIVAPAVIAKDEHTFAGWRRLAGGHPAVDRLPAVVRDRLDGLAELEARWPAAAAGDTLLHGDLRADNLLIADDTVWFVDWPHAAVGAPWLDLLFMLPSVAMQGGAGIDLDLDDVWAGYGPARGADPDAVNAMLAAVAGYFVSNSLEPAPPNLPRIREFQRAQGTAALTWLWRRLRVPTPS